MSSLVQVAVTEPSINGAGSPKQSNSGGSGVTRRKQCRPAKIKPNNNNINNNNNGTSIAQSVNAKQPASAVEPSSSQTNENELNNDKLEEESAPELRLGPFPLAAQQSTNKHSVTLTDVNGERHKFNMRNAADWLILKQLQLSQSLQQANCLLSLQDQALRLQPANTTSAPLRGAYSDLRYSYVTRPPATPVPTTATVATTNVNSVASAGGPVKQFACDRCGIASFNCRRNLDAHQTYYCKKRPSSATSDDQADAVVTTQTAPPPPPAKRRRAAPANMTGNANGGANVCNGKLQLDGLGMPASAGLLRGHGGPGNASPPILLPVALSRTHKLHVLGRPQVIVPVAVPIGHASTASLTLQLDAQQLAACQISATALIHLGVQVTGDNSTQMAPKTPTPNTSKSPIANHTSPAAQSDTSSAGSVIRPGSSGHQPDHHHSHPHPGPGTPAGDGPLDLSVKPDQQQQPGAVVRPADVARPFTCACGVSFSSQITLDAHHKFYCQRIVKDEKQPSAAALTGGGGSCSVEPTATRPDHDQPEATDRPARPETEPVVGTTTNSGSSTSTTTSSSTSCSTPAAAGGKEPQQPDVSSVTATTTTTVLRPKPLSTSANPNTQPTCCAACDFIGANMILLVQHQRSVHGLSHAFTCVLCGYRGYSVRGMKSHMRSHDDIDKKDIDAALLQYVVCEIQPPKGGAKQTDSAPAALNVMFQLPPPTILCPQCHACFTSINGYTEHNCRKTESATRAESTTSQPNGH